jgi:ATP-dependent Clp protease adaptor protein ClpS
MSKDKPQVEREEEVDVLDEVGQTCSLIVWNDNVNTFEWVISTRV